MPDNAHLGLLLPRSPGELPGPRSSCPLDGVVQAIGGKWKMSILWHLLDGARRYGELRRLLPGITERMLVRQLRELEEHRIVVRTQYPGVPPRVEYALTERGQSLVPVLQQLVAWSVENLGGDDSGAAADAGVGTLHQENRGSS